MATTKDQRWLDWTDKFLNLLDTGEFSAVPMDKETSEVFVSLCLAENAPNGVQEGGKDSIHQHGLYKMMAAHSGRIGLKIGEHVSEPLMVFLLFISKTPGVLVMWVHAMKRLHQSGNGKRVDFWRFSTHFPIGLPGQDAYLHRWEGQKDAGLRPDNYLDTVVEA